MTQGGKKRAAGDAPQRERAAQAPRRTEDGSAFAACPACGASGAYTARAARANARRLVSGAPFMLTRVCACAARTVALTRINEHLDSDACGAAAPPPPPRAQRPPAASPPPAAAPSPAAASAPCAADAAHDAAAAPPVSLATALRWSADAVPAARRYGQHTGRATGVLPPPPAPPPLSAASATVALLAAHGHYDGGGGAEEDDEDGGDAFRQHFRDDGDDGDGDAGATHARPSAPPPAPSAPQLTYGLRGHLVLLDFLSAQEEASLLRAVDAADAPPWRHATFNGRNRGKAWGVDMSLARRAVYPEIVPFPTWLVPIVARLRSAHPLLRRFDPNHVNAIEYTRARGDHLSAHVDDRKLSGDIIVNVSLAGECVMTYAPEPRGAGRQVVRRGDPPPVDAPGVVRVPLPRRCAQVQSGAARFEFTHGIANADLHAPRRVSLTLRESAVTHARRPADAAGSW
jgi:alkylated DNA repair protein alkB family protein 4